MRDDIARDVINMHALENIRALSAERGTPVKPRLSFGFLTLRATRLPFLTATIGRSRAPSISLSRPWT